MSGLALFGLLGVTAMLVCYALERRSPWFVFGFAIACVWASAWVSARRVAVRTCRGDLGDCGASTMAVASLTSSIRDGA
jgi:hypothetical protein